MKTKPRKIEIGGFLGEWNLFVFDGVGQGWRKVNNNPFRTKKEALQEAKKSVDGRNKSITVNPQ